MFADLLGPTGWLLASSTTIARTGARFPASPTAPGPRAARHARHARVNDCTGRSSDAAHALPRVMHRTRGLAAPGSGQGNREPAAPRIAIQFPSAVLLVTELAGDMFGGEQRRGIHTPKLHHHPRPTHPHQTAKGPELCIENDSLRGLTPLSGVQWALFSITRE